jgi:SAM-dependent methyltransferase
VRRNRPAPVAGELTALALEPRGLRIDGWAVPLTGGALEGFRVLLGTKEAPVVAWRPRRSIGAGRSGGFRIAVRATADEAKGALVTVIPRIAGRNASPLFSTLRLPMPLPPRRDREAVAVDFQAKAFRSLNLLVGLGGLQRDARMLDVGCGVGRLAYGLVHYFSPAGRYDGFDGVPRWVAWNRRIISSRFPHFRFRLVRVENRLYSRRGHRNAARLRFPYENNTFDTVMVESVFQHNRVAVVRRYLAEIARVLRPRGRCVVTCFLLRSGSIATDQRAEGLDFLHPMDGAWSASTELPEIGVAFEAERFMEWVDEAGLHLAAFHRGEWHGEGPGLAYQDVIALEKPAGRGRGGSRRRRTTGGNEARREGAR